MAYRLPNGGKNMKTTADGKIIDAVKIDDGGTTVTTNSRGETTTYNETIATINTLNAIVQQVHLGSRSPSLRFPLVDNPAYSGKIRFKLYRQKALSFNANALKEKPYLDNVKEIITGEKTAITDDDIAAVDADIVAASEAGNFDEASALSQKKKALQDAKAETEKILSENIIRGLTIEEVEPGPSEDGRMGSEFVEAQLYFPLSVTFNDDVQYEGFNLGGLGAGALSGLKNNQTITQAVAESVSKGLGNIFNFAFGNLSGDAAKYAAAKFGNFGPQGLQTALTVAAQAAVNPNTRTIFRGVTIREFSFNFKMIPRSAQEAREIASIIKFFRSELYPEAFDVGGLPLGYHFPNMFKIELLHRNSNAKIPQLEYCFLRGVQSSYNPTGQSFHADGYPNEIDLTLRFQEYRALSKKDIVEEGK
jgi:hypothetical protein